MGKCSRLMLMLNSQVTNKTLTTSLCSALLCYELTDLLRPALEGSTEELEGVCEVPL